MQRGRARTCYQANISFFLGFGYSLESLTFKPKHLDVGYSLLDIGYSPSSFSGRDPFFAEAASQGKPAALPGGCARTFNSKLKTPPPYPLYPIPYPLASPRSSRPAATAEATSRKIARHEQGHGAATSIGIVRQDHLPFHSHPFELRPSFARTADLHHPIS